MKFRKQRNYDIVMFRPSYAAQPPSMNGRWKFGRSGSGALSAVHDVWYVCESNTRVYRVHTSLYSQRRHTSTRTSCIRVGRECLPETRVCNVHGATHSQRPMCRPTSVCVARNGTARHKFERLRIPASHERLRSCHRSSAGQYRGLLSSFIILLL